MAEEMTGSRKEASASATRLAKELSKLGVPCQLVSHESFGRRPESVAPLFNVQKGAILKTVTFVSQSGEGVLAVLQKGLEVKTQFLEKASGKDGLRLARASEVVRLTGSPLGGASPIASKIPVFADSKIPLEANVIVPGGDPELSLVIAGKDLVMAVKASGGSISEISI